MDKSDKPVRNISSLSDATPEELIQTLDDSSVPHRDLKNPYSSSRLIKEWSKSLAKPFLILVALAMVGVLIYFVITP